MIYYFIITYCLTLKIFNKSRILDGRNGTTLLWPIKTYFKNNFRNQKKPITLKYTVHTLLCKQDYNKYWISISTLSRHLDKVPIFYVYSDGSLTKTQIQELKKNKYIKYYSYAEVNNLVRIKIKNRIIKSMLNKNPFNRKLISLLVNGNKSRFSLILDSDVIFFRKPVEMLKILADKYSKDFYYIQDFQNAYIWTKPEIKKIFKTNIKDRINTGLLLYRTRAITLNDIADYYKNFKEFKWKKKPHLPWIEQTAIALICSRNFSEKLPSSYYINNNKTPNNCTCRHYTATGIKYYFDDFLKIFYQ
jgi:hypothetical protein